MPKAAKKAAKKNPPKAAPHEKSGLSKQDNDFEGAIRLGKDKQKKASEHVLKDLPECALI